MKDEAVKKLIEDATNGVDKKNGFKITFVDPSSAQKALVRRGILTEAEAEDFEGPDFKDIKGFSLNGPWVVVQLKDDVQYVYPAASIARIKTYTE